MTNIGTGIARNPYHGVVLPNDVLILAGRQRGAFHLNKATLARTSTYFHALFSGIKQEQGQASVTIERLEPNVFKMCIEYIYTGAYTATNSVEHAQAFCAALFLGIPALKSAAMRSFSTAVLADIQTRAAHRVQRTEQAIRTLYAGSTFAERHQQTANGQNFGPFNNTQQSVFFNFLDNMMQSKFLGFGEDRGVVLANTISEEVPELMLDMLWVRRIESYMRKVLNPKHVCKQCRVCTDSNLVYLPCRNDDNKPKNNSNNNANGGNNRQGEEVGLYVDCEPCGGRRGATWICKVCNLPKEAVGVNEQQQDFNVIR